MDERSVSGIGAEPSKTALYQIGAGYAAVRPLSVLKQPAALQLEAAILIGRPVSIVVDAPRADEDTILFHLRRAFGDLPLGRRVLTRRRTPSTSPEVVQAEDASNVVTAPDLGGALFKACAPLADDELVMVFTNAHAEARRLLRALGGAPIDALEEKPVSQRRPSSDPRGHFAFAG